MEPSRGRAEGTWGVSESTVELVGLRAGGKVVVGALVGTVGVGTGPVVSDSLSWLAFEVLDYQSPQLNPIQNQPLENPIPIVGFHLY